MLRSIKISGINGIGSAGNTFLPLTAYDERIVMAKRIIQNKSNFPKGIPEEKKRQIIAYYQDGNSTYETGVKFGVSATCVGSVLKSYGIARRGKSLKRDVEIIQLYLSGIDAPQFAQRLGLSCSHIYNVLRRNKIERRNNLSKIERNFCDAQKYEIVSLYEQGLCAREIAKKINIGSWGVIRFLKKIGIERRSRGALRGESSHRWRGGVTKNKEYQRKKRNAYNKHRRDNDPLYKLECILRNRMNSAFKVNIYKKQSRTHDLLGANYEVVMQYIQSQFQEGMTWENHGKEHGKWNLDHIIPLVSAATEEELLGLFYYKNLMPLWWIDNMKKGSLHEGRRYYKRNRGVA